MEPSSPRDPAKRRSSSPDGTALRSRADARVEAGFALLLAAIALTCAGGGAIARARQPEAPAAAPARTTPPPVAAGAVSASTSASAPKLAVPTAKGRAPELERFWSALDGLARHERADSVRILWLGDSHTAADFLTGKVRELLARRYGYGGPGFVRLGVAGYRHDAATSTSLGRFTLEPTPPARRAPQGDGVFGFAGICATPSSDGARLTLKPAARAVPSGARFTVLFELPESSAFVANIGAQSLEVDASSAALGRVPGSPILRVTLDGAPGDSLTLDVKRGRPRFFGAIVESRQPGIVLDTAGIDGARLATVLAWADAPFVAEVAARRPELFVLAYGTNEAFDRQNPKAYEGELRAVLERLRRGAPGADCLILGPPDALAKGGDSEPRIPEIAAAYQRVALAERCAFVSQQALMGGPGSFRDWLREKPELSRPDRIHFTQKGYGRLGELVAGAAFGEAGALPEAKNSP